MAHKPLQLSSVPRAVLIKRIESLQEEVAGLENEVLRLSEQLLIASKHGGSKTGHDAEKFVVELLNGQSTVRNADHDLVVKGGKRIEVKGSKCNTFRIAGGRPYYRWTWHNFLGVGKQQKDYDRLILVGEALHILCSEYKDPDSPFVLFDLPIKMAREIANARKVDRGHFSFPLMALPSSAKSSIWSQKVWQYQVTREELVTRYRIPDSK